MAREDPNSIPAAARVRVSASTSNLGPGFDALGLALDLGLDVVVRPRPGSRDHELSRLEGSAREWPPAGANLLVRAFERAQRELGGSGAFAFEARSEIPISRGLGSSGSAIAAGLLLGSALAPRAASREELLSWAIELEGHPDNVAPALLGGCVLCSPRLAVDRRVLAIPLSPSLGFAVAWPDARLETAFARSLLPSMVPIADAIETARGLALLIEGLRSGAAELLAAGNDERLHVPYRLPHIPGGRAALESARRAGASLATISGSGSALLAVCSRERAADVAAAMGRAFHSAGAGGEHRVLLPVLAAPEVERF